MKIVVLDGYVENPGDLSWKPLEDLGELTVYDRISYTESPRIAEAAGDAEVIVTNKTPISAQTLDACPGVKLIAVLATGYNVVDYEYAAEKGIPVVNVPAYGTQIVAQYAVGMLLEICAHFQRHSDSVYEGRWQNCIDWCYWDHPMIELAGKTAGIIGLGRIGQTTAGILKALGMNVLASDAHRTSAGESVAEYVDTDTLYARSDVIFLHCPLFPETEGMINKDSIARMKDGVILINNSRGQLIVEQDLADALNSGKVYAAAVDVVSTEPIEAENPLLGARNCLITPHLSWAAKEARQRILDITAENIRCWQRGEPQNVVNGVQGRVEVLLRGFLGRSNYGRFGYSTCALISMDSKNILFDCGNHACMEMLQEELHRRELTPEDIDIVVLSHLHYDHTANLWLFPNAEIVLGKAEWEAQQRQHDEWTEPWLLSWLQQRGRMKLVSEGQEIVPGLFVMDLPGHTAGCIGLRLKTEDGTVVLAGDALKTRDERNPDAALMSVDPARSRAAIERILAAADIVIPGHDEALDLRNPDALQNRPPFVVNSPGEVLKG